MQKTNIYKTMKSFFWFFFQILNYVIKFPDWPLPGYHGNRVKNPASWFCANCSYVPPSQFWKYCENWLLSYVCYRVWPIRGLAWLPWQPDWNDNHFQKVRAMGFVVVYYPCGLAFRKVLKFDVENWAVDHWTPLNYLLLLMVSKCSLEYVKFKMSVLISPSKSLISSRWVTHAYKHVIRHFSLVVRIRGKDRVRVALTDTSRLTVR